MPVEGDELPAGWDEAFERGMEAGGGNVLSLLAISVSSSRRGGGLATQLIGAAREAAAAGRTRVGDRAGSARRSRSATR